MADDARQIRGMAGMKQRGETLAGQWQQEFGNAMQAMADIRPAMEIYPDPPSDSEGMLWWKQSFDLAPGAAFWVGAPQASWTALGQKILTAAGLDSTGTEDLQSTYLEVIRQSLGALAGTLTGQVGHEVLCTQGAEEGPSSSAAGLQVSVTLAGERLPNLAVYLSRELLAALQIETVENTAASKQDEQAGGVELSPRASGTLDLLLDVEMPVSVSFGRTRIRVQEILKLITGSIIELDRTISEPVEVIVNNCVIARGEVVVVDGNYGVRIHEVLSRHERLQESRRYLLPVAHRQ